MEILDPVVHIICKIILIIIKQINLRAKSVNLIIYVREQCKGEYTFQVHWGVTVQKKQGMLVCTRPTEGYGCVEESSCKTWVSKVRILFWSEAVSIFMDDVFMSKKHIILLQDFYMYTQNTIHTIKHIFVKIEFIYFFEFR